VVVHFENAEPTLFAVVSSLGLPGVGAALLAVFDLHEFTLEWRFHSFRDASWVGGGSSQVSCNCQRTKTIENKCMDDSTARERNSLYKLMFQLSGVVPVENAESVTTEPTVAYQ
jgi:hypothetical protein